MSAFSARTFFAFAFAQAFVYLGICYLILEAEKQYEDGENYLEEAEKEQEEV